MTKSDLHSLTLTETRSALDRGDFSAVELVDALLARIEALNPTLTGRSEGRRRAPRRR